MAADLFDWIHEQEARPAAPTPPAPAAPAASVEERFAQFLRDCPDVYPAFIDAARRARSSGMTRWSADAIGHIVRWERLTEGKDAEGFKLNNDFIALIARKAMAEYPELAGFFETRHSRVDVDNDRRPERPAAGKR